MYSSDYQKSWSEKWNTHINKETCVSMFAVACWSEFLNWEIFHQEKRFCYMHIVEYVFEIFSSVQFSRSFVSNSLQPHESQHARPPCPSPAPGVYSNSCPSSRWCHPAISSSVVPFSSCPQSLPASGSFPMSQLWDFNLAINLQNTELSGKKKKKQLKQFAEWCKASILWSPDAKSQLIGKDPDAGKDWGQEKKWGDRGWGSWMALPVQWTWA